MVLHLGGQTTKVLDKGSVEYLGPYGLSLILTNLSNFIGKLDSGVITSYALYILSGLVFYLFIQYTNIIEDANLMVLLYGILVLIYLTNYKFVYKFIGPIVTQSESKSTVAYKQVWLFPVVFQNTDANDIFFIIIALSTLIAFLIYSLILLALADRFDEIVGQKKRALHKALLTTTEGNDKYGRYIMPARQLLSIYSPCDIGKAQYYSRMPIMRYLGYGYASLHYPDYVVQYEAHFHINPRHPDLIKAAFEVVLVEECLKTPSQ